MAESKTTNIQSIQFLRGIAAFMVLLNHGYEVRAIPDTSVVKQSFLYGWMGVQIFFIISGFIIPYTMFVNNYRLSDFKSFFLKRITRIEPPYIVSVFLVLIIGYLSTCSAKYSGPPFTVNWLNVAGHIGYINAFTGTPWLNASYWTLAVEFEFYILLALLYPLITHSNKLVMTVTYLALLSATYLTNSGRHIIHYLPFFLFGISLVLYRSKKVSLYHYLFLLLATLAVCYLVWGIVLSFISLGVLLCISFMRRVPEYFLLLGAISYSLYLTHGILITRFIGLAGMVFKGVNAWVLFGLSVIGCLVFAWVYYITVERFFLNLSKKIKYNHPRDKEREQFKTELIKNN